MALSREKKEELVEQYIEQLKQSQGFILIDYRGLSVNEISEIREQMRPLEGKFQVIKNRLLSLALQEIDQSIPDEWLVGPTAASFCYSDVPPIAKVLTDTAKDLEILKIKGGLVDASVTTADQIRNIASLPPKEVLLGQVLGAINAPASQVAGAVTNGVRQILNVLQAYVDKLEESEDSASSAPAAQAASTA